MNTYRADTPDFFRIYIRGGYVYIRDPNQEKSRLAMSLLLRWAASAHHEMATSSF